MLNFVQMKSVYQCQPFVNLYINMLLQNQSCLYHRYHISLCFLQGIVCEQTTNASGGQKSPIQLFFHLGHCRYGWYDELLLVRLIFLAEETAV
jgi:hypothetical protein